ncbi:hypothetical protein FKM82_014111 [Ascaphus truei]
MHITCVFLFYCFLVSGRKHWGIDRTRRENGSYIGAGIRRKVNDDMAIRSAGDGESRVTRKSLHPLHLLANMSILLHVQMNGISTS